MKARAPSPTADSRRSAHSLVRTIIYRTVPGTRGQAVRAPFVTLLTRPSTRCGGFTLIEIVISSALMSLILVSGYLCLSSGISGQRLIDSRSEAVQSARVAMAMISADLRAACPLSRDLPFLGMRRILGEIQADNLDFGTHHYTPRRAREGDFCEVSYFVDIEQESGKFSLWRRRDPSPDDEPLAGGSREEIARGVRGLKLEYYDGWDWYDDWGDPQARRKKEFSRREHPNLYGMPEAVRITLWIEPASRSLPAKDKSEPPLVFQTVARLNLAAISQNTPAAEAQPQEVSEPKDAAPNEGEPP
jgi:prepilin-type N-terminal cleavage/methylation domain-containing protein